MNFCKMCGTSLAQKAPQPSVAATIMADMHAPAPAAAPAQAAPAGGKINCPSCAKQTPAGFAFCQHCGTRLQGAPAAASQPAPMRSPSAVAPAASPMVNPTPPAGMPRPSAQVGPTTAARNVSAESMAKTMAPTPEMMEQVRQQVARATGQQPNVPFKSDTLMDEPAPRPEPQAEPRFGVLVTVNRDGTDGETLEMTGEAFDVGRTEGKLRFAEDAYLALRHARFLPQNGKVIVRPIDAVNGIYIRVQGSCDLQPGDHFLVGKEVIRYEPCAPEEKDPPSLCEHGVRLFGSAPRESWGRLRQMTVAGTARDVWHLARPELVLGREEGDVTFPDDEFMSRRHAAVKRAGAKAKLEDLHSSNGTFLRIKGDRELQPGDVLRMGDQLLRFEG
jgi:hypothetical protein